MGFLGGSDGEEPASNVRGLGLILGFGRSLEEGIATHSSILAWIIPMDTGTWGGAVHGGHKESDMTEQLSTTTITAGTSSIKNAGIHQHCRATILQ